MLGHCECASEFQAITNFCHGIRQSSQILAANSGRIGNFYLCKEAVAATSNGFHKAGTFGGVAEGPPDFSDRFVKPVVEIHERVCWPECLLMLFARYDCTDS